MCGGRNLFSITIYVPVVGAGPNVLMLANPFRGPLEGVGPDMAKSKASAIWVQKSRDFQELLKTKVSFLSTF